MGLNFITGFSAIPIPKLNKFEGNLGGARLKPLERDTFERTTTNAIKQPSKLVNYDVKDCLLDDNGNRIKELADDTEFVKQLELRVNKYDISAEDLTEYMQFVGADMGEGVFEDIDFMHNTLVNYKPFGMFNLSLLAKSDIVNSMSQGDTCGVVSAIRTNKSNDHILEQLEPVIHSDSTRLEQIYTEQRSIYEQTKLQKDNAEFKEVSINGKVVPIYVKDFANFDGKIGMNDLHNMIKSNMLTTEILGSKFVDFTKIKGFNDNVTTNIIDGQGKAVEVDLGVSVADLIKKVQKGEKLSSNETHAVTDWLKGHLSELEPIQKDVAVMNKAREIMGIVKAMRCESPNYKVDDHFYMRMIDRGLTHAFTTDSKPLNVQGIQDYCYKIISEANDDLGNGSQSKVSFKFNANQDVTCFYCKDSKGKIVLETIITD